MADITTEPAGPAPGPGSPSLEDVRSRVDHVVVLVLENRSFDHLFGFADLPGADPLVPDRHPNPVDPTDPTLGHATPNDQGAHILAVDPPHSHGSAKQQLGAYRRGRYCMDGFVDAYRRHILGQSSFPVIHWRRVTGLGVVLGLLLTAAAGELWRRITGHDGWAGLLVWAVAAVVATALLVALRPLGKAADLPTSRLVAGVVVVAVALTLGVAGVVDHVADPRAATPVLAAVGVAVGLAAVALAERKVRRRHAAPDDPAAVAAVAAAAAEEAKRIMRCLPPDRVKVLRRLAEEFATCHRWFSSVPGATWPNRNFIHAGTSAQSVDIEIGFYDDPTVFELLDAQAAARPGTLTDPPWRIYRDGMPQVMAFPALWRDDRRDRWRTIDQFVADCAAGDLPTYAFLEPRHSGSGTNSLHPGNNEAPSGGTSDFARGEQLVRRVYHALRDAPGGLFDRTVLVVTFDEHGGLFDHVSPPRTVHPAPAARVRHPVTTARRLVAWFVEHRNAPFDFRRLGVRVPTLVVSPLIEPGTADRVQRDHTSVIATVRELFAPDQAPLGRRDAAARPFWDLLTRTEPRATPAIPDPGYPPEVGPESIPVPEAPTGPVTTDADLTAQLVVLAEQADAVLDARGAPQPVLPEGETTILDKVDARLTLWFRS
ncbi:MAG TPA: alkaline phosphatase family protein [Acidimicrobiales bacterium]